SWQAFASADGISFSIRYVDETFETGGSVQFHAPAGEVFHPNTRYAVPAQSSSATATASVFLDSMTCSSGPGEFTIHDLVVDGSGVVQRFSADFSLECSGASIPSHPSVGSIYYNAVASLPTVG